MMKLVRETLNGKEDDRARHLQKWLLAVIAQLGGVEHNVEGIKRVKTELSSLLRTRLP